MCYMKLESACSLIISSGLCVREDETVGWHHWLNGHEFEQTWGESEGQGSLVCCSPLGCTESDVTNWRTTPPLWVRVPPRSFFCLIRILRLQSWVKDPPKRGQCQRLALLRCSNDWVRVLNTGLRFQAFGFNCLCLSVSDSFMCWDWLIGVGYNGTPLQYSCLENPMDGRSLVGCSPWGR